MKSIVYLTFLAFASTMSAGPAFAQQAPRGPGAVPPAPDAGTAANSGGVLGAPPAGGQAGGVQTQPPVDRSPAPAALCSDESSCGKVAAAILGKPIAAADAKAPLPNIDSNRIELREQLARKSGQAQGLALDTVAADTLQLVGELVTDRASTRAFELAKSRLKHGLACPEPDGANSSEVSHVPEIMFPATCEALTALRIQDLAAAPKTLEAALAADFIVHVKGRLTGETAAHRFIDQVLLPLARRDTRAPSTQDISSFIQSLIPGSEDALDDAAKVGALAALAAGECLVHRVPCVLKDIIAKICKPQAGSNECPDPNVILMVATDLVVATTAIHTIDGAADVETRVDAAFSAVTRLTCVTASKTCEEIVSADMSQTQTPEFDLARLMVRLRAIEHALITNDGLGVGFAAARFVDDATLIGVRGKQDSERKTEDRKQLRRSFRLLATLLNYAETYTGPGGMAEESRSARKQILQSLVDDFTARTERGDDWVFSVGGSLRAAIGARVGSGDPAVYGPASLVLGFGLDHVGTTGFHAELGLVDLGEYLSFTSNDGGPFVVEKPSVQQAFSPSLTLAWSFAGPTMPVFVGAVGGAAPFRDDEAGLRWYFGIAAGVHVPLFDIN
jgi:hypothetical protein